MSRIKHVSEVSLGLENHQDLLDTGFRRTNVFQSPAFNRNIKDPSPIVSGPQGLWDALMSESESLSRDTLTNHPGGARVFSSLLKSKQIKKQQEWSLEMASLTESLTGIEGQQEVWVDDHFQDTRGRGALQGYEDQLLASFKRNLEVIEEQNTQVKGVSKEKKGNSSKLKKSHTVGGYSNVQGNDLRENENSKDLETIWKESIRRNDWGERIRNFREENLDFADGFQTVFNRKLVVYLKDLKKTVVRSEFGKSTEESRNLIEKTRNCLENLKEFGKLESSNRCKQKLKSQTSFENEANFDPEEVAKMFEPQILENKDCFLLEYLIQNLLSHSEFVNNRLFWAEAQYMDFSSDLLRNFIKFQKGMQSVEEIGQKRLKQIKVKKSGFKMGQSQSQLSNSIRFRRNNNYLGTESGLENSNSSNISNNSSRFKIARKKRIVSRRTVNSEQHPKDRFFNQISGEISTETLEKFVQSDPKASQLLFSFLAPCMAKSLKRFSSEWIMLKPVSSRIFFNRVLSGEQLWGRMLFDFQGTPAEALENRDRLILPIFGNGQSFGLTLAIVDRRESSPFIEFYSPFRNDKSRNSNSAFYFIR